MNHTYRLIWSHRSRSLVVVGEHARRCGKSVRGAGLVIAATLAAAMLPIAPASAAPTGGEIKQGAGSIAQLDLTNTLITQTSSRLAIDWKSFSSAKGETIEFKQPGPSSIVLNRVISGGRSELMGSLKANGQVFVINPNGVLFGQDASVNVGGLVASTLDMNSESFFNGSQVLEGGGMGSVLNQGKLTAGPGGYIALVGPRMVNEGMISTVQGRVLMAAGDKVTLTLKDNSLMSYTIDRGSLDALVQNKGVISAAGSEVTLTARAADDIGRAVINQTGLIEAQALEGQDGTIRLLGDMKAGELQLAGKLDASAATGGKGGLVETSAARVRIDNNAEVTTLAELSTGTAGKWLVQANNLIVGEASSDNSLSLIPAAMLARNLRTTNTELNNNGGAGSGDIIVDGKLAWNGFNSLTLSADRNIYIHADISATDTAATTSAANNPRLVLKYNQASGANNEDGYFLGNGAKISLPAGLNFQTIRRKAGLKQNHLVITELGREDSRSVTDLQGAAATNTEGNYTRYALGADIDASQTARWNGGAGFKPFSEFYGVLDGLGHTITNLTIAMNAPGPQNAGLIGLLREGASVQNLTMASGIVSNTGENGSHTGSVVGRNAGVISNVHTTMTVESPFGSVGGLVGYNALVGRISGSSADGVVKGGSDVGGLAGLTDGLIEDSHATGSVAGISRVGGLAGRAAGEVRSSYAMAQVQGSTEVGGLIGRSEGIALVENSYVGTNDATRPSVTGASQIGGLIGHIAGGTVRNSYAATGVAGNDIIGGLVGLLESGEVAFSYSSGRVAGSTSQVGGLIGKNDAGIVRDSFWNRETSRQESSAGGTAKSAGEMRSLASFSDSWSINDQAHTNTVWRIYDGQTMPLLRSFLKKVDIAGQATVYNGQQQQGCTSIACDAAVPVDRNLSAATGTDAGTYAPFSNQQGYDIKGGTLTITPLALAVSAAPVSKIYDRNTSVSGASLSIAPFSRDDVGVSFGSAAYEDWNAGESKKVTFSDISLSGRGATNYTVPTTTIQRVGAITPRMLGAGGLVGDKVYDGDATAILLAPAMLQNQIAADMVQVQTNAAQAFFADKGAGVAKTVTITGLALTGKDAGNYAFDSTLVTNASIRPRALAVSVQGGDKIYDGHTNATVALADNLIEGDLFNLGYGRASFADSTAGANKVVAVTGITASGADAGNYVFDTSATTTAGIARQPLIIAANGDSKSFDGKAYRGGNGVNFSGFVVGENERVLGGQPGYGGDAQGAVDMGSYRILPEGYASQNYAIVYVGGKLTIESPKIEPVNQPGGSVAGATAAAMNEIRFMDQAGAMTDGTRAPLSPPPLYIAKCGVGMFKQVLNGTEDDCLASALQPTAPRRSDQLPSSGN
jgi:filamentous hemagglutinin family protein